MPKSPTKPSTPRLSDIARHVVVPKGMSSSGWPAVQAKCADLGITPRPWQPDVGRLILAKRSDGKYAATIGGTGMSIPRQVGKTFLVGMIIFALCLLRPNLTVIWTAHRLRTAAETFAKMQVFAKRAKIKPHILKTVLGSGDEAIIFRNGSRILFGARESGFGLGFDEVDVLIFDEAQRLRDMTLDDMIPAMNQSRQDTGGLLLFMGTPPRPTDSGEVFTRMRTEVLTGEDDDTSWVEFGADEDYEPTPAPAPLTEADWAQITKANPSHPEDTPREAILRMRKKLGPESFKREGAGVWDPIDSASRVIPLKQWEDRIVADEDVPLDPASRFALTMSPERIAVIASAVMGEDANYLDLVEIGRVDDSRKLLELLSKLCGRRTVLMIDQRDPAASFVNDLRNKYKVKVNTTGQADSVKACTGFVGAVDEGRITHCDQPPIRTALLIAQKKPVGKFGQWEWNIEDPTSEMAALRAMTNAHYGLSFSKKRSGEGRRTGTRRGTVL